MRYFSAIALDMGGVEEKMLVMGNTELISGYSRVGLSCDCTA
jgi:hypothetical protein